MSRIRDIYLLLVVVFSGQALAAFRSHEGLIILWGFGVIIFWRECLRPRRVLLMALAVWLLYFAINTVTIGSFHPFFMGTYVAKIMIAYWLLTHYAGALFGKFEDTIVRLALLSLVGYLLQIAAPGLMLGIMSRLDLSQGLFEGAYASVGLYTVHMQDTAGFARNAGFTWEPGPFSCFLVLALFVNLARNKFILRNRSRIALLLLTLLTTQSTTGAVLLLVLAIWYVWVRFRGNLFRPLAVPFVAVLAIAVYFSVPWIGEKIAEESTQSIDEVLAHAGVTGKSYNPGRFASLELRLRDFRNYPVAGFGGNPALQYGYLGEDNVVSAVGGLGGALAQYGAIGFSIIMLLFIRSGSRLAELYRCRISGVLPVLLIISGFAFSIFETPMVVSFWMAGVFLRAPKVETGSIG